MIDKNLEKQELKLTASKRRVLITDLVAKGRNLALMNDCMCVEYFKGIELLIDYTKSEFDNNIKL